MDTTGVEKSKIENEQREMRKKEKEEGREWERRYFTKVEENLIFTKLAAKIAMQAEPDKTGGIWVFDEEKAKKWGVGKKEEEEAPKN